ncbi:MAG: hypothetical protein AB7O59_19770 [Pirellulales bacterium]
MALLLKMLNEPDLALLIVIGLLMVIGSAMNVNHPLRKRSGNRIACAAFLAYSAYGSCTGFPQRAEDLLGILIRAVLALGFAKGCAGIGLAVVGYVNERFAVPYRHRRHVSRWEPPLPALPAPSEFARGAKPTEREPVIVEEETVVAKVKRERAEYEDRLLVIEELRDVAGLTDEMIHELHEKELTRYLRKVTDVLGY